MHTTSLSSDGSDMDDQDSPIMDSVNPSLLVPVPTTNRRKRQASLDSTSDVGSKRVRKRAKTAEEKEERARERILRNRLAAQSSRERKRDYVSSLETENGEMVTRIATLEFDNKHLQGTVSALTTRLTEMERILNMFVPPPPSTLPALNRPLNFPPTPETMSEGDFSISKDLMDVSADLSGTLQHIPAVNVDLQCQSTRPFPWNIHLSSPIYRTMYCHLQAVYLFWTTLVTTFIAIGQTMTILLPLLSHRPSRLSPLLLRRIYCDASGSGSSGVGGRGGRGSDGRPVRLPSSFRYLDGKRPP